MTQDSGRQDRESMRSRRGLTYLRRGVGSPVLLIHGWCLSHVMWTYLEDRLVTAGHQVVIPDLAGFGSSADLAGPYDLARHGADTTDLLDELELDHAILVGFAFGGAVLMSLPSYSRISGLVLIGVPSASAAPYRRMRPQCAATGLSSREGRRSRFAGLPRARPRSPGWPGCSRRPGSRWHWRRSGSWLASNRPRLRRAFRSPPCWCMVSRIQSCLLRCPRAARLSCRTEGWYPWRNPDTWSFSTSPTPWPRSLLGSAQRSSADAHRKRRDGRARIASDRKRKAPDARTTSTSV